MSPVSCSGPGADLAALNTSPVSSQITIQLLSCPGFCGCWGQKPFKTSKIYFSEVDFPFTAHWLILN